DGATFHHPIRRGSPMVIAQARGGFGGGPGGHADIPPAVWAVIGVIILVALAIGITIQVFYLLTMSRCYSRIAPRNRRMEPGLVWLNLIPGCANIWICFTTIRLADSLQAEFRWRRLRGDGDFGRTLGITYPILALTRGDSLPRRPVQPREPGLLDH